MVVVGVTEEMPLVTVTGVILSVVGFETIPCASAASRAAFSLAFLALSRTSACGIRNE